jgi:polyisoprenoid-binding protein YceI
MKKIYVFTLSLAILLVSVVSLSAQQKPDATDGKDKFYVNDPVKRNTVTFKSTAPLEDIVGTTNEVTGYLNFDPDHPQKGGQGELKVAVSSLNTGIPTRDEHLVSKDWMDAESYPHIVLKINELKSVNEVSSNESSATYDITASGEISIKGKTKKIEFPGRITFLKESEKTKSRMPGDLLAARAELEVSLADFGISGPKGMDIIGSKVGETITIEASLMASNSPELALKSYGGE